MSKASVSLPAEACLKALGSAMLRCCASRLGTFRYGAIERRFLVLFTHGIPFAICAFSSLPCDVTSALVQRLHVPAVIPKQASTRLVIEFWFFCFQPL